MAMLDLYRALSAADPNCTNRILTVVDGNTFGAKCFLSGDKIEWETPDGFFSGHLSPMQPIPSGGMFRVDGHTVFCEALTTEKKVILCGGGHVGLAVVKLCRMLGYPVTLLEDREEFAREAQTAGADWVICAPFEQGLEQIPGDVDSFFVIATRAHEYDQACLRAISRKKHAYIGLMGSKHRVSLLKQALIQEGAPEEVIQAVHSPIGLAIGAETPEEIAVSILAEIIAVKSRLGTTSYPRELLHAIVDYHGAASDQPLMLATIIHGEGSAPRSVGTKMLVRKDGSFVGTIGGGRVETLVLEAIRARFAQGDDRPMVLPVDLTNPGEVDGTLLCGGKVDILIESI